MYLLNLLIILISLSSIILSIIYFFTNRGHQSPSPPPPATFHPRINGEITTGKKVLLFDVYDLNTKIMSECIHNNKYNVNIGKNYTAQENIDYKNTKIKINGRDVDITKPLTTSNKKLPVIIYFQPEGDYGLSGQGPHDYSALKSSLNFIIINKKAAIVFLYPDPNDIWYYMNNGVNYDFDCSKAETAGVDVYCWNSTTNPDKAYLQKTIALLQKHNDLDLDHTVLLGYSAGAQMVSNAIGEFPFLTTLGQGGKPFPEIKAAFMIGGGSQYCYAYEYIDSPPEIFLPCHNKILQCCPQNTTEKNFMSDKESPPKLSSNEHPPTFLFQTEKDEYADSNASNYYFNSCIKFDFKCGKFITKGSTYHGLVKNQMIIFINLILFYLTGDSCN